MSIVVISAIKIRISSIKIRSLSIKITKNKETIAKNEECHYDVIRVITIKKGSLQYKENNVFPMLSRK